MAIADFRRLKKYVEEAIVEIDRQVRPSKEEDAFFLGVDFYRA